MAQYPEHEKLEKVKDQSQSIGEFLDWLQNERHVILCTVGKLFGDDGIDGYVAEHILVWEQIHNQPLPAGWVVHHLNGIGIDNRPENIVGLPDRRHRRILAAKAQRIRELETKFRRISGEIDSLRQAILAGQLVFNLNGGDTNGI